MPISRLTNKFSEMGSFSIEFTKMNYLAQQPGGLTDNNLIIIQILFRTRNWFKVDWNLAAIDFNYELSSSNKINSRTFGLLASRESLGYLDQINRVDPMQERNLISGNFKNIGNETRFIHLYEKEIFLGIFDRFRIYKGNSIGGRRSK